MRGWIGFIQDFGMAFYLMDLYKLLGVERSASASEIKQAFRALAQKMHPDRNGGQGTDEYQEIQNAYDVLKDPSKRKRYDETGESGKVASIDAQAFSAISQATLGFMNQHGYQPRNYVSMVLEHVQQVREDTQTSIGKVEAVLPKVDYLISKIEGDALLAPLNQ